MSARTRIAVGVAPLVVAAAAIITLGGAGPSDEPRQDRAAAAARGPASATSLPWPPFPRSRYWSRPIAAEARTDRSSGKFVAYLDERLKKAGGDAPYLAIRRYGVPVWIGRRGDPVKRLSDCHRYDCPGVGGARLRVPAAARPDPGDDGHMVLVDRRRMIAYDLFRARADATGWSGAGGARVRLRGGDGSTGRKGGATAANSALLAGLIIPGEIRRGRIDHALAVTVPGIGRGAPRCPARNNVPTTGRADAPPLGTRFQLDPELDLDALKLSRLELVIAKALQRYGMIVVDNGGQVAFRGENFVGKRADKWARLGYRHGDSLSLGNLPLDRLRVIAAKRC